MNKLRFICKRCGHKCEAEVFELGEAEEKKMLTREIRCPKCGGLVERQS